MCCHAQWWCAVPARHLQPTDCCQQSVIRLLSACCDCQPQHVAATSSATAGCAKSDLLLAQWQGSQPGCHFGCQTADHVVTEADVLDLCHFSAWNAQPTQLILVAYLHAAAANSTCAPGDYSSTRAMPAGTAVAAAICRFLEILCTLQCLLDSPLP